MPKAQPNSEQKPNNVVGNAVVLDVLERAIAGNRLAHAYLFVGPEGVGKTTVARQLAARLLGSAPHLHPDFAFVERERDAKTGKPHAFISIEQVQALTARLSLAPLMNGWRVAILDCAHLLNDASANALLKRLEEPHPKTLLMLTAQAAEQVIPTIRSRCQVLRFGRVATHEIVATLFARGISAERAELFARLSDGRPGIAIGYAEDSSSLQGMFALREAILAMPAEAVADRFAAIEKAVPPKLPFLDAIHRSQEWADLAAEILRDAMLVRLGLEDRVIHVDVLPQLRPWANGVATVQALEMLGQSQKMLASNVTPRATLERVVARF